MRVLLVEDDASVALMIKTSLIVNGHPTDHARDYQTALELMNGHTAVILDVLLGDGHLGTELMREFDAPVIILTSLDEEGLKEHGVDLDGIDRQIYHVQKPVTPRELLALLENVVRTRQLLENLLIVAPNDPELTEDCNNLLGEIRDDDLHARDFELLDRWRQLPGGGKDNAIRALLLDDVRAYLGKK